MRGREAESTEGVRCAAPPTLPHTYDDDDDGLCRFDVKPHELGVSAKQRFTNEGFHINELKLQI